MTFDCARKSDIKELKELWKISFGDTEEYLNGFFSNVFKEDNTLIVRKEGRIVSMLFLLDGKVKIQDEIFRCAYLYAACTHVDFRGQGIMGELLKFSESYAKNKGYDFICLVPASKSLFDFYSRFGYQSAFSDFRFSLERENIKAANSDGFKIGELNAQEMFNVRENSLSDKDHFIWDENILNYAIIENELGECESCAVYKLNEMTAYALFYEEENEVIIRECAFNEASFEALLSAILKSTKGKTISFRTPCEEFLSFEGTKQYNAMLLGLHSSAQSKIKNIKNAYMGHTLG